MFGLPRGLGRESRHVPLAVPRRKGRCSGDAVTAAATSGGGGGTGNRECEMGYLLFKQAVCGTCVCVIDYSIVTSTKGARLSQYYLQNLWNTEHAVHVYTKLSYT